MFWASAKIPRPKGVVQTGEGIYFWPQKPAEQQVIQDMLDWQQFQARGIEHLQQYDMRNVLEHD